MTRIALVLLLLATGARVAANGGGRRGLGKSQKGDP